MTRFALAALLALSAAAPALAQDYGRPDDGRPGYNDPRAVDQRFDDRRDDGRRYDDRDRGYDRQRDDNRGDRYDGRNRGYAQRGEGWSILRAASGPDRTRDQRFVRATLQNFDRNRDGILTRQEGWQARRALGRRGAYGQRW